MFAASILIAHAQSASFRWIHQIGGSGGQSIAGVATDAQGNTYVVGNTTSLDFPVRSAIQPHPAASGLFRVDGPGANWQNLYQSGVMAATAVAIDPRDPRTVYATTITDVRKSSDGGATWVTLAAFNVTRINGITVDPENTGTLYVTTAGQGILRSIDGGLTWIPINTGVSLAGDQTLTAYRVWVHPSHPSILFAAIHGSYQGSLVRSADAGATWQTLDAAALNAAISDISFDPFTPGKLYAASIQGSAVSTDDGLTWSALGRVDSTYWQPGVIVPDPNQQGKLYGGTQEALWISSDSGATWIRKVAAAAPIMTLDRTTGAIYAVLGPQLVITTDGFATTTPLGPPAFPTLNALAAAAGRVFVAAQSSTDAFVVKYDRDSNIVFATYFGGSATDLAGAMAVDASGAVYVTGTTQSLDFPVTSGAYAKTGPAFLFKLNPDGSLAWSTYFAAQPNAIAVDAAGHAFLAGVAMVGFPVTPGAYQTGFTGFGIPLLPQTNGFLSELDAAGASLVFSTYIGSQGSSARAVALFPDGSIAVAMQSSLYHLDPTGSTLLAKKDLSADIRSLAPDGAGNILVAGASVESADIRFPTTPGAFQTVSYPVPSLPGTLGNTGGGDAFVMKLDAGFNILASTLLGGEASDVAISAAAAPDGSIVAGGSTYSKAFPARGPIQGSFSPTTGFVTQLTADFSSLVFSTFSGDTRPFYVRSVAIAPDGGILMGGSTSQTPSSNFDGLFPDPTVEAFVVRVDPLQATAPRIDSVVNAASQLGVPLSPGETIQIHGDGFGDDASVFLNGAALPLLANTRTTLTAAVPPDFGIADAATIEVRSAAGRAAILVPVAPASPGVFSQDGSGLGQGYILNKDGTLNSPGNPAREGDAITIFATGVGTMTFDQGYAVTDAVVDVRVDGFSAAGIAAVLSPVAGLAGTVYQISVFVPRPSDFAASNPNLLGFQMPPQVAVTLKVNGATSQAGLALSVGQ